MKNQYTVKDLYALKDILSKYLGKTGPFDFYVSVLDKLKEKAKRGAISSGDIEEMLLNWLTGVSASYPRVTSFIFNTKLIEVPLFLNHKDLRMFVEWRLKIAK